MAILNIKCKYTIGGKVIDIQCAVARGPDGDRLREKLTQVWKRTQCAAVLLRGSEQTESRLMVGLGDGTRAVETPIQALWSLPCGQHQRFCDAAPVRAR